MVLGNKMIWTSMPYNKDITRLSKENYDRPLLEIFARLRGKPVSSHQRLLVLDIAVGDAEGDAVMIPPIKVKIHA